jgi:hypothetical protein
MAYVRKPLCEAPASADLSSSRTRELWQRRAAKQLSAEDLRQITENVTSFFSILAEWSRARSSDASCGERR